MRERERGERERESILEHLRNPVEDTFILPHSLAYLFSSQTLTRSLTRCRLFSLVEQPVHHVDTSTAKLRRQLRFQWIDFFDERPGPERMVQQPVHHVEYRVGHRRLHRHLNELVSKHISQQCMRS